MSIGVSGGLKRSYCGGSSRLAWHCLPVVRSTVETYGSEWWVGQNYWLLIRSTFAEDQQKSGGILAFLNCENTEVKLIIIWHTLWSPLRPGTLKIETVKHSKKCRYRIKHLARLAFLAMPMAGHAGPAGPKAPKDTARCVASCVYLGQMFHLKKADLTIELSHGQERRD